ARIGKCLTHPARDVTGRVTGRAPRGLCLAADGGPRLATRVRGEQERESGPNDCTHQKRPDIARAILNDDVRLICVVVARHRLSSWASLPSFPRTPCRRARAPDPGRGTPRPPIKYQ